jgi:hypothetical protein
MGLSGVARATARENHMDGKDQAFDSGFSHARVYCHIQMSVDEGLAVEAH